MRVASLQHCETCWVVWPLAGEKSALPFIRLLGQLKAREASVTLNNSNSLKHVAPKCLWAFNKCKAETFLTCDDVCFFFSCLMYQHCWDETFPVSEPHRDIFHPLASFDRKPSGLISNTHTHAVDRGHKQKMFKSLLSTAVPDQLLASRAPAPDALERLDGRRLGLVGKHRITEWP